MRKRCLDICNTDPYIKASIQLNLTTKSLEMGTGAENELTFEDADKTADAQTILHHYNLMTTLSGFYQVFVHSFSEDNT